MSKKLKILTNIFVVGIFLLLLVTAVMGGEDIYGVQSNYVLQKPTAAKQVRTMSNIGNWAYWIQYDGWSGRDPTTQESGGIYPRGTAAAIFQDGIVWGGYVRDGVQPEKRVGGQTYSIGTTPGRIISTGLAQDLNDADVRIYRIRKDWATLTAADVKQDAAEINSISLNDVTEAQTQAVLNQYALDWQEWPVDYGAPFYDENGNGIQDAGEDPGLANADQVIWFVVNDLSEGNTAGLYGSKPMGIELQVTLWAYNQSGSALGQMIFKKYKFINKSGVQIDSMFVAQWVDPDLGNFADDLVGCDTLLSMGYVFNGSGNDDQYADFGLPPAAAGYDFFQGPVVFTGDPADTAVFDLKYRTGYKNLPMTSFSWFAAGSNISDPPLASYQGTTAWYNMLNGFTPTVTDSLVPYVIGSGPGAGNPTVYPLAGDPVTGVGDIDGTGTNLAPADRRMVLASGPFNMAIGDTQEVVIALVGGIQAGGDQLTSVSAMKSNDDIAQKVYNTLFQGIPNPPSAPKVTVTEQEDFVVLEWGSDAAAVNSTENTPFAGYAFEGYNVYQLPNANAGLDQAIRIATYDLVNGVLEVVSPVFNSTTGNFYDLPIQFGTDIGIKRYFIIEKDYINDITLNPGNEYYFAVTAYNFNANPQLIQDRALESSVQAIVVVPQSTNPGIRYGANIGEEIEVTHSVGGSDGIVKTIVVDPEKLTGHEYEVFFELDSDTNSATYNEVVWNVRDNTLGTIVLTKQSQVADVDVTTDQPIFDGLQVRVSGPPLEVNDWEYTSGTAGPLYPSYADGRWFTGGDHGGSALFGGLFIHTNFWGSGAIEPADLVEVQVEFTPMTGYEDWDGNGEFTIGEPYTFEVDSGQKAFMYQTWGSGNYLGFFDIPFKVFDVSDPANPRQLNVFIRDRNANSLWDLHTDPFDMTRVAPWNDVINIDTQYNYTFIMATDYDATGALYDPNQGGDDLMAILNGETGDDRIEAYYAMWLDQRGSRPMLAESGDLKIIPNFINTVSDVFTFTIPENTESNAAAVDDVKKINVFPNPYYAYNPSELNRTENFVTFTHLPQEATIRIFNLAGVQVRKIEKNSDSQFERWDLQNESGLPVASGIYFVHVDMPKLGTVKNLKVFIVQSQQILEYY